MAAIQTSNIGHVLKRRYKRKGTTDISGPQTLTRKKAGIFMRALNEKIRRARKQTGF